MILFLIPLLDLIVYSSMKSYARELSNAGGKGEKVKQCGSFLFGVLVVGIVISICLFFLHFYHQKDLGKKFFENSEKPFNKKSTRNVLS